MIEVFVLVLLLVIVLLVFGIISLRREDAYASYLEQRISLAKDKLKLAEKKFFTGKIKKPVFDVLLDDLESELALCELDLFSLKRAKDLSVEDKANALLGKIAHPNKYRKAKLAHMLAETELLNEEINILESKFMKREIRQSVFEKLMHAKEKAMLDKESEIVSSVRKMNE